MRSRIDFFGGLRIRVFSPFIVCVFGIVVHLGMSTILSAQTNWTKYVGNPVLYTDPGMPSVLHEDGIYKMWYSDGGASARIHYAKSPNGKTWTDQGIVLDIWAYWPFVIRDGDTLKMWYSHPGGAGIGYARSLNGINWTDYPGNPVLKNNSMAIHMGSVIIEDETLKMWYVSIQPDGSNARIIFATSPDGKNWTDYGQVMEPGETGAWDNFIIISPWVLKHQGVFHMWYGGSRNPWNYDIGYATSMDGITWQKYSLNPVLEKGELGEWDCKHASSPSVLLNGIIYRMWYTGNDGRIGYAEAPIDKISVNIDIKPGACPNPLNLKSKGILPVAVLGDEALNVSDIDPYSIQLEGVTPIRWNIEDVSTPVIDGNDCDCTTEGADGYDDLTLKFKTQEIVAVLGEVEHGDELVLTLTGQLNNATPIEGKDCIIVKSKGGKLKKSIVQSEVAIPDNFYLSQNHPNPFNPVTTIRYQLPEYMQISLVIYNMVGQEIRRLVDGEKNAGYYEMVWDGRDQHGEQVGSGMYLLCMKAGSFTQSRKLLFLK